MKSNTPLLLVWLALAASLPAQTITGYGVIKQANLAQTSSSDPVATGEPYLIKSYVFGTGLAGTYSFTPPGGSAHVLSDGQFSDGYGSSAALNTAYPDGVYAMALPNTNGIPQSANLPSFSGDAYPVAPKIQGGTWSGNTLLIDPAQNYVLTFANFTGFTGDDSISLTVHDASFNFVTSDFANTSVTSFTLNAGTFVSGETYSATLLFNNNFIDYGVAISGANGNSGFTTANEFQISAIPEPSTYAAILAVLALAGVVFRRRGTPHDGLRATED